MTSGKPFPSRHPATSHRVTTTNARAGKLTVMVRIIPDEAIAAVLDLEHLLSVVEDALIKQGENAVERPERPHYPIGTGLNPEAPTEPLGTGLTMPAYLHGADYVANKLVTVHPANPDRDLPTVRAQITLADAKTGDPAAYMDGTRITNARTGCIGGLAARDLADSPITLGIIGAGTQARWQARAVAAATDIAAIKIYSPSDSKVDCAADLRAELDVPAEAVESPASAVTDSSVVITATTAESPVFPGNALAPGTLVVAIGAYTREMQELDATTMDRASRIFADVPDEAAATGDVENTDVDPDRLEPFTTILQGTAGRTDGNEIIVVLGVGTAVMDAAAAEYVYSAARDAAVGEEMSL